MMAALTVSTRVDDAPLYPNTAASPAFVAVAAKAKPSSKAKPAAKAKAAPSAKPKAAKPKAAKPVAKPKPPCPVTAAVGCEATRAKLYEFARKLLCRRAGVAGVQEADDAVQETLIKGWNKRHTYDASRDASRDVCGWLCGILKNHVIDMARRKSRRPTAFTYDGDRDGDVAVSEREAAAERLRDQVREYLDALDATSRQILTMRHLDEMAYADIARDLGISAGAARTRLSRAMAKLRATAQAALALSHAA